MSILYSELGAALCRLRDKAAAVAIRRGDVWSETQEEMARVFAVLVQLGLPNDPSPYVYKLNNRGTSND